MKKRVEESKKLCLHITIEKESKDRLPDPILNTCSEEFNAFVAVYVTSIPPSEQVVARIYTSISPITLPFTSLSYTPSNSSIRTGFEPAASLSAWNIEIHEDSK